MREAAAPVQRQGGTCLIHLGMAVALVLMTVVGPEPASAGGPPERPSTIGELPGMHRPAVLPNGRPTGPVQGEPAPALLTGRVLVKLRSGVPASTITTSFARADVAVDDPVPGLPSWTVVTPTAGSVEEAIEALAREPAVTWAEPEYRYHMFADPLFGNQWGLHNAGQTVGGIAGATNVDMNLPEAWAFGAGSPSVTVAVIDTGVDFTHPDLGATAWTNPGESGADSNDGEDDDGNGLIDDVHGWNFCSGTNDVFDPAEPNASHGTAMASLIAAPDDANGLTGVAPGARIMALKVFDASGFACGTVALAQALAYAAAHGVKIANASWGTTAFSLMLHDAVAAAGAAGMLLVAAAGNSGLDNDVDPTYPASFDLDNVLSVAAINNEGLLPGFSNYGATSVDIAAPGQDVLVALSLNVPDPHDYGFVHGTSPAAANVSGVAALIGSVRPSLLNAPDLKERILATGKPVHNSAGWTMTGRIPDAQAALAIVPNIVRLAGSDRYKTAASISAATYFRYPFAVMVATGATFPDALSGGAVAAQLGFPLLLVAQHSIPPATAAELTRLQPQNIIVLGGPGVVSNAVAAQLGSFVLPGGVVARWAGADRFATSAVISFNTFPAGMDTAYISTGLNFPDALAAAPPSALSNGPLLLVRPTAIPPVIVAELDRLEPGRIVILGGPGVVSNAVAAQLDAFTDGPVTRVYGSDRYQTAAAISSTFFGSAETAYVATGTTFPDALAGGSAGGQFLGPMLLVPGTSVPPSVVNELERFDPARIFILGGPGVVSNGVVSMISGLFH